jgi:hypothetical protein
LESVLEENHFFNSYLPLAYLYRHAVELCLKSVIIIIHRGLELPFGPHPASGMPMIQDDEEWVPMGSMHSLSKLGLDKILPVLRNTADQLSILHFSLRCELAGGN